MATKMILSGGLNGVMTSAIHEIKRGSRSLVYHVRPNEIEASTVCKTMSASDLSWALKQNFLP